MLLELLLPALVSVHFFCLADDCALDQGSSCVILARRIVTLLCFRCHGDQQKDPFTALFVTLDLLGTVTVPMLLRYYKHNIGTVFGVVCMVYFSIYMHIILILIFIYLYIPIT